MIPEGFSRETTIRRTEEGVWFHDGEAVEHPGVRKAFDSWVGRAEDGRYILQNEVNWAYVEIEGAPVFVVGARVEADRVELQLNDQRTETLDFESLRQDEEGFLFCSVRDGRLTAKFTRNALFDLDALWVEDDEGRVAVRRGQEVRPIPIDAEPVR